jgi:hypothetical protein
MGVMIAAKLPFINEEESKKQKQEAARVALNP